MVDRREELEPGTLFIEGKAVYAVASIAETAFLVQVERTVEMTCFLQALENEACEDICREG